MRVNGVVLEIGVFSKSPVSFCLQHGGSCGSVDVF